MHIDDFPTLWATMKKPKADRVRNHVVDKMAIGTGRTRWIQNPHHSFLSELGNYTQNVALDDILSGIVRLEDDSPKLRLSAERLFVLLAYNRRISTDLIMVTMGLQERQARRYMAAAKLAIFFITRNGLACDMTIHEGLIDNPWMLFERSAPEVSLDYL